MNKLPYDQRFARLLVKPLAGMGATPNAVTTATLVIALAGAGLFALGPAAADVGAGLFVLARFLDHVDGELARFTGRTSRFGYYYDYAAGAASYAALFLGMGVGQVALFGPWALALGGLGAAAALISLYTNLGIDQARSASAAPSAGGYPSLGGIEVEDGIYLIAPITWLGLLSYFFLAASLGAAVYCLWTILALLRARGEARS